MSVRDIVQAASGSTSVTYVDDVFSTYLYTGNGSTQTITNGIDLAGMGGLVWIKQRNGTGFNCLFDTVRGINSVLTSNAADAVVTGDSGLSGFTSSGFSLDYLGNFRLDTNGNTQTQVSWTFRKAPKFFDVVTYTGTGASQNIAHSLGVTPGMIIVKRTDAAGDWSVWHKNASTLYLNSTAAATTNIFGTVNASTFGVTSTSYLNASGGSFVAYLFAHDTATDGIVQCGSFTTDVSGNASVNLGWEPQYILAKANSISGDWYVLDTMRGLFVDAGTGIDNGLSPNLASAEANHPFFNPTATGFNLPSGNWLSTSSTYIYVAIRRPNKPPTSGTQVYNAITRTGTGASATVTGVGFAPDIAHVHRLNGTSSGPPWNDRLRGAQAFMSATATTAESSDATVISAFDQDGISVGIGAQTNGGTFTYINHFLKRAPRFLDIVCYTGTAANTTINHNLEVVPEMMIIKRRDNTSNWQVYHTGMTSAAYSMQLNLTNTQALSANVWNSTVPTRSVFSVGTDASVNASGATYVSHLFATLPNISKVGSYIGNGSSQTINCGFLTGARFVLIKNSSAVGDWYVWDSARGIVAANDPHLSLNTTAAEVTTDDSIDPDVTGFIVNNVAATNINVTSNNYIYLAIA